MKPVVLSSILFACSAVVVAQSASNAPKEQGVSTVTGASLTSQPVQTIILPGYRCPISMHARQGSSLQLQWADNGKKQPVMTPTLELMPQDQRVIVSASVTVHGYSGGGGALTPAVANSVLKDQKSRKDVNRTLTLRFKPSEPGKVSAQFSLTGMTVIESIGLNSVTYADGSTWKLSADRGCTVAPDPLLLVDAH